MGTELRDKLFNYEENPPKGLWQALSATLDEGFPPALAEKLERFEAPPPPAAWQKIEAGLLQPQKEETPVVPFFRRYHRPLRYTGAAAIMAFFAIVLSLTISKKTISETPGATANRPASAPARINTVKPQTPPTPGRPAAQTAVTAYVDNEAPKRTTLPVRIRARYASLGFASFTPPSPRHVHAITSDGRMDDYMIYTDEEGRAVRLPKKLFDAIACPLNTSECRERLRHLQERMAAAAINPGFGGILDLVNHMKENQ